MAVGDLQRAVRVVRHHASAWGLDPHRVGVLGCSAGGLLASFVATTSGSSKEQESADNMFAPSNDMIDQATSARPDLLVLVYPVTRPLCVAEWRDAAVRDARFGSSAKPGSSAKTRHPASATNQTMQDFDTVARVSDSHPPTFLAHSTEDTGLLAAEHTEAYFAALTRCGVRECQMVCEDFGEHGCALVRASTLPASLPPCLLPGCSRSSGLRQ